MRSKISFLYRAGLGLAFFLTSLSANAARALPETLSELARTYAQAKTMREWVEKTPGLSAIERKALLAEPRFVESSVPAVAFRKEKDGSLFFTVGGLEFDFTKAERGEIVFEGRAVRVHRGLLVQELAARLQKAVGRHPGRRAFRFELLPSAFAAEGITSGCATKDLFTLYDVFTSPFGFVPHIWIAAAAVSVQRWAGDQFRNCERQVKDLRELLRSGGLAVKSLACGNDNWGADRKIEFWVPERDQSGEFKTRRFDLDYTNYFAREEAEARSASSKAPRPFDQKLYVFGTDRLKEVRLLTDSGGDFYEKCRTLSPKAGGSAAAEFAVEESNIEAYRKVFYYIGQYNTCTACRLAETRIVSPRPPSYFPGPVKKNGVPAAVPESSPETGNDAAR